MHTTPLFEQPAPTEAPPPDAPPATPGTPKRRRIATPVFSTRKSRSILVTGLVLCLSFGLHAQTTPGSTSSTPQTTPQPTTPQNGWTMFDERIGSELQIPADQLQQLRDLDGRYQREYAALGTDPISSPKYMELTERRNAEIRNLMDAPLYEKWSTKYSPVPNTIQEQRKGNSHTSTPPPPTP